MTVPPSRAHYQWLDLLRFIAALFVVLDHSREIAFVAYAALASDSRGILAGAFFAFTRLGHEAVIVFFVLSGYLVGGKAIERMISGSFDPKGFAIDRLSRIWVPLVPALVLSSIVTGNKDGILVWVGNLFGLQGAFVSVLGHNSPLWSLSYEIWFYVLTYAAGRLTRRRSIDAVAVVLIGAGTLVFSRLALQFLACWIVGALFYLKPHRLKPRIGLFSSMALCAVAVAALQLTDKGVMAVTADSPVLQACFDILLAIGTGMLCVTLVSVRSTRISTAAVPLAAFSYTLYLTHFPFLVALERGGWKRMSRLDASTFGIYSAIVVACTLSAWGMYWLFEKHTPRVRTAMKRVGRRSQISVAAS